MSLRKSFSRAIFFFLLIFCFSFRNNYAQLRAGASFLKMGMGVRISSMGLTSAGELRDNYAIFTNPGAAGFLREWYWAASYSKWIADVFHASFIFNKRIRMPWSNQTRFSVGAIYQGVPQFDSSDNSTPVASANDLLFSLSIGQPLTFISNHLSFGTNIKYFKSKLDNFTASTTIFDVGLLARTRRFHLKNSWMKYGIISAGISLTQNGKSLQFDRQATPLPQTLRTGLAFYAGSHNGIQLQICGDYFSIKDERGHFSLGAAVNFTNLFSLNFGYNFNNDLMDKFSFGGAFQLDDFAAPAHSFLPGRNKAARLEIATLNEGEFFSRSYQGSAHYFPNCPESFEWKTPAMDDTIKSNIVQFRWEKTRDPDIFDSVSYILLLSPDRKYLSELLSLSVISQDQFINKIQHKDSLLLVAENNLQQSNYQIPTPSAGHYYWSVIAADENFHVRAAENRSKTIAHFLVPATDIEIKDIKFKYSPWITEDDYQGELEITISNNGDVSAKNFLLTCKDSVITLRHTMKTDSNIAKNRTVFNQKISELSPKSTQTITIPWHTPLLGQHAICAIADENNSLEEKNIENNYLVRTFSTIPKGLVSIPDTINSITERVTSLTMPLITRIFFDENSAQVPSNYLFGNGIDPYLSILAQRLIENPKMSVRLQGVADPNSEKASVNLALSRAKAVKDSLIRIGVSDGQIKLMRGKILPKRRVPSNPQDAKMVFEDRRYVEIFTIEKNQEILFAPLHHQYVEYESDPVLVNAKIFTATETLDSKIKLTREEQGDSLQLNQFFSSYSIQGKANWHLTELLLKKLTDKTGNYNFELIDSEGRRFKTHDKKALFIRDSIEENHRIVMPLKFARTEPIYSFYWHLCFKEIEKIINDDAWRFRFNGHACAIGSKAVNLRLSRQRVRRFDQNFRQFLKKNHPQTRLKLLKRLDKPEGFGESAPLKFRYTTGEEILFGDNERASGRILNRRIELELYRTIK